MGDRNKNTATGISLTASNRNSFIFVKEMKVFRRLKPLLAIGVFFLGLSATAYAQCGSIDFVADKTDGCHPTIIKFSAQGIPSGSTITWDFGFGERPGKDTSQNVYTSAGSFTVVLKVLFSDGVTVCTISKPNYINIRSAPTPNFTVSKKVLCDGPEPVTITDVSSGTYTSRNWVVDGIIQSDSSQQITYPFANTGMKEVMLVLKSAACPPVYYRVDSAVRIYNKLEFDFKTDISSGCLPAKITFTAENITPGHTINSYEWTFNGGTPANSSLPQPTITYNNAGTFPVTLRLTNSDGCSHTVNHPDLVKIGDSSGFSVTASKSKVCNNEIVTLSVSDPSSPGTFIWELGKGVSESGSTPHQQRVKFNDTGFVTFKVTREYNGCKAVRVYTDLVYVSPPVAWFRVVNTQDCEKDSKLKVENLSLRSKTETYTYDWRLYDGSGAEIASSTAETPDFATNAFGSYSIKLVITGSGGCSDERYQKEISRSAGVAEINISTEVSCINGPVTFFSSSDQFANTEPNFYTWTIYGKDGVTILKKQSSGIIPKFTYRFNDIGEYNVMLEVHNSRCSASVLKAKYIKIIKPSTSFTISDTLPCVNTPVFLSASSTPPLTPDYYYNWIFENSGDTSYKLRADSIQSTSITPDTPGLFNFYLLTNWANGTCTDTLKKLNYIKVSGAIISVALSKYSGCDPMTANATGTILVNHNYRNPSDKAIQYTWGASPASGVVYNSPNSQNSQVTFNLKGAFRAWLLSTNGSGCTDTAFAPKEAHVGVKAGFKESTLAFCVGDTIGVADQSSLSPDRWEYFSNPPGAVFLPSNTRPAPDIYFPDSGKYLIYQVVSKANGCFDTALRTVISIQVVADFTSADTLKYCAPAEVVFDNHSRHADSLTWYFGDGRSRTVPNADQVVYVYFKNSGRAGFDVKLVATNSLGCADSIVKLKYITVLGPVPDFRLDTTSGCTPLTVTITDSSRDYSQYYFDYGDGSPYDTTGSPPPHVYENIHPTDETVSYQPRLYMTDEQGCFAEYVYPSTVDVHRYPEISFTADPDSGCSPLVVQFFDSSKFAKSFKWDFDNDGVTDDSLSASPSHTYLYKAPGIFSPKLTCISQHGCEASDTLVDYITTFQSPTADFTYERFDNDTMSIYFDFQSQSTNYTKLTWYIDSIPVDSSPAFRYPFLDTGYKNVLLVAESDRGCIDTQNVRLFVVPEYYFFIPNAFTPNNNGVNEKFGINAPMWARRFTMRIFNRFGQQIFETRQATEHWDGTFKGQAVEDEVYVYTIEFLDMYGYWHIFKGSVLVMR